MRHVVAGSVHNSQVLEVRLCGVQRCRWEIYPHQTRRRNVECLCLTPFVWLKCQKRCRAEKRNERDDVVEFTVRVESRIWLHCFSPQWRETGGTETMRGWQ